MHIEFYFITVPNLEKPMSLYCIFVQQKFSMRIIYHCIIDNKTIFGVHNIGHKFLREEKSFKMKQNKSLNANLNR